MNDCIYAEVKLDTNVQEMQRAILEQFAEYLNDSLNSCYQNIDKMLKDKIRELLLADPASQSLISGELRKNLGVRDGASIINDMISALIDSVEFTISKPIVQGSNIVGGYNIKVSRGDFQDVLGVQGANYSTTNGVEIPWLSWLLFSGDNEIIYGYRLELNPDNPQNSRTGAIMVKTPGRSWGVPNEFAGTITDNFITRALSALEDEIPRIIEEAMV